MSNDEVLSSDAESSRPAEGAEDTSPVQDASDAPPAAPPRARRTPRARAAGSDAASTASPDTTAPPARATHSRRKATASSEEAVPTTSPDLPVSPPGEAAPKETGSVEETSAHAPSPTSRRRRTKQPVATTDSTGAADPTLPTSVPPIEAPAPDAPQETERPALETDPAARGRRTRRPRNAVPPAADTASALENGVSPTPKAIVSSPSSEAPVPPVGSDTDPADAPARSQKRRGSRTRRKPTEADGSDTTLSGSTEGTASPAQPETNRGRRDTAPETTPETSLPDSSGEGSGQEQEGTEGRRRRERPRRSRRDKREERTRLQREVVEGDAERAEVADLPELPSLPTRSEPEPLIDTSVGAHLIVTNGVPQISINSSLYPPLLFFGNLEGPKNRQRVLSEVRRAAGAGIHLHSTLVELPCPLSEASHALDEIDDRLRAILDADPEGFVMPRVVFLPARGWKREYPTDIATYADGTSGDPSLTSDRFWREAEHSLETMIVHLRGHEWGKRIFGYHLERGEWFQPADQGYDRSIANRDAFRDWLREKYKNSLVALRAAWYDGDAQFHTAEIPPLVTKPNQQRAFFEPRRERRTIDFHEFTSESTARRLVALSRVVKKATENQALTSVCYGYTLEFGHGFSGHLALATLLQAPTINMISGPPSYRDRKSGGAASLPGPYASFAMHGKLWLSEDDTKTHLAPTQQDPDDFNPRLPTREATENAHIRALGRALAQGTGVGWMDLWGEGWLDDDGLWDRLATFDQRYRHFLRLPAPTGTPDVIALIDEKSLLHVQRGETFFRKMTNGLRDTLQRAGISLGIHLQSDILSDAFPLDATLYLFLTPYRLTTEQRNAIKEKLQRDGKTLAWLYAPGSCEERTTVASGMEEVASGIVGISIRQQAWNSELGSRIVDPHHVITERLGGREFGTRERLSPSFYVADEEAQILAEYQASSLPSLAARNHGTWKSVFVGDPVLPLELLRGICRYAGVPVWVGGGEDVVYIGNGWVTLHASRDGQRTLRLPIPMAVYDVTERRLAADETREYRFFLRAGQTRVFCVGTVERFKELDLPNLSLSGTARDPRGLPAVAELPAIEPVSSSAPTRGGHSLQEDLETLQAIVNMDLSEADDLELDEGGEEDLRDAIPGLSPLELDLSGNGDAAGVNRRRRRRGGRGRGRKRFEGVAPDVLAEDADTEKNKEETRSKETGMPSEAPIDPILFARIYHSPEPESARETEE